MTTLTKDFPWEAPVPEGKAALWFLGQAGYYFKTDRCTAIIDPYLSDSAGRGGPNARVYPPPVDPASLKADIVLITHDHIDHLDPMTLEPYAYKNETVFIAPRLAAKKLRAIGIPDRQITVVDHAGTATLPGVRIDGVFALANGPDVLDTCGYLLTFDNGKTVYHTSDAVPCKLMLRACPKDVDVLLTCINGKYGNLHIDDAVELTLAVRPKTVIPNHYDVMPLNSENPESFRYFLKGAKAQAECVILGPLERYIW